MSMFFVSTLQAPPILQEQASHTEEVKLSSYKQRMHDTVEHWKEEISRDEQFSAFADASWEVKALGPGTHSFLVLFFNPNEDETGALGYLILHETKAGGLEIGEYGKGLYEGLHSLYESPFTTVYQHPFEAIYIDNQHNLIDVFTNEVLPLQLKDINQNEEKSINISHDPYTIQLDSTFDYSLYTTYFSPYEKLPWLSSPSINNQLIDDRSIEADIEHNQSIYYRIKAWGKKVSTVFAVTSIHKWNDHTLFIGVQLDDEEAIRYLPFEQLLNLGNFYSS